MSTAVVTMEPKSEGIAPPRKKRPKEVATIAECCHDASRNALVRAVRADDSEIRCRRFSLLQPRVSPKLRSAI